MYKQTLLEIGAGVGRDNLLPDDLEEHFQSMIW